MDRNRKMTKETVPEDFTLQPAPEDALPLASGHAP